MSFVHMSSDYSPSSSLSQGSAWKTIAEPALPRIWTISEALKKDVVMIFFLTLGIFQGLWNNVGNKLNIIF